MSVVIQDLAVSIAEAAADRHPEKWQDALDPTDRMGRTIAAEINLRGWEPGGIDGALTLVCNEIAAGRTEARSTFNDFPCSDVAAVRKNPAGWYISDEAALRIRNSVAPRRGPDGSAPKRPITKQEQMNAQFLRVIAQLNYDPKALPANESGKAGVRSEVARAIGVSTVDKSFEHCWERALKDEVLAYTKTPR